MTTKALGTCYVCGPMSNIPHFNFPLFRAAAKHLRSMGYEVISPAETDSPAVQRAALKSTNGDMTALRGITGESHGDLLAEDVRLIADRVDTVVVLPGWRTSRGARLETFVAFLYGKPVRYYPTLHRVPRTALFSAWTGRAERGRWAIVPAPVTYDGGPE